MKIKKRDLALLIVLLGIGVFLVCYLAVYNPVTEENDSLKSEISSLRPRLAELQAIEAKIPSYNEGIAEAGEMIQSVIDAFPTAARAEDFIMYAVALEENIGIDTAGMSFSAPELRVEIDDIRKPGGEIEFEKRYAYKATANINNYLNYDQMKEVVGYVYERSAKTTLDTVSINYNAETGELYGFIVVGKYYLTSLFDPYIETYVPPMDTGVENPFRVIETAETDGEEGDGEGIDNE